LRRRERDQRFVARKQRSAETRKLILLFLDGTVQEEAGYMVEVRSIPIPHAAVVTVVEQEMELKRNLVGLVDLNRVDG